MLSPVDLALLAGYFAVLGLISWKAAGHGENTREYLLGGREVPWWAVLGSIIGTEISALTFVGVPALAYTGDWTYLQLALGAVIARILVARYFVRAYYEHQVTSIYEFLLLRFGPVTRNLGALTFLVTRVLMSGVRLYAGTLVVKVALGVSTNQAVLLLTVLALAYTLMGGIRAVIWTEVLQVTVMFVGATAALVVLWLHLPAHWWVLARPHTRVFDLSLDPAQEFTLWTALIGATFSGTAIFGTDYDMVQRMLTARNCERSTRAVVGSGLADIPIALLFLAIGTLLRGYYLAHPDPNLPASAKEIFPYFILTALPAGLAGLLVAAVLSVVLSTFESALTALAGSFVIDVYRPYLARQRSEAHYLKATRWATLGFALALALVAVASQQVEHILKFGLEVGTYTYGALLGVFGAGLFTRLEGDRVAWTIPGSILVVVLVKLNTSLAFPWFVTIGTATSLVLALLICRGPAPAHSSR